MQDIRRIGGRWGIALAACLVWATAAFAAPAEASQAKASQAEAPAAAAPAEDGAQAERYLAAVRRFADTVLERGRDRFGQERTPLFVDGLHAETLEPAVWLKDGQTWVLSNFASQQPLVRLLDGLAAVTGEPRYRREAEATTRFVLERLQAANGLLYWGGHAAWDLEGDRPVGQYGSGVHEVKSHRPYYRLMWRVDAARTARLMQAVWAAHIVDWARLDYNRHGSLKSNLPAGWDHPFQEDIEVPFPAKGGNLSFVNVTPTLLHSSAMAAVLGDDAGALEWSRRLVRRWQQGRDPKTGLCGGQLSYRAQDRAQEALGHVHPAINEARIVASYHQTCRYHTLPLAQMQDGLALKEAGGARAEAGEAMIRGAAEDLLIYARQCYDRASVRFIAKMTDGTPLRWQQAKTGYYIPEAFAPCPPDGFLLWGYALAYRLTGDAAQWSVVRDLANGMGLGDLGEPGGAGRAPDLNTRADDWRLLYVLLELDRAEKDPRLRALACCIADNILKRQTASGLFPRPGKAYARTGDEAPLALLHLAAALEGREDAMPAPAYDSRFFHCEYHGQLEKDQTKRGDARTYDNLVYYGGP